MTKIISSSVLSKELQKRIKFEVSNLKQSKKVISKTELSDEAKVFLDKVTQGKWTQRGDGKIDVKGDVNAYSNKELHLFMGKEIFFGEVGGNFECRGPNITSLVGSPEKVGGNFDCRYTNITSLKGAPKEVGGKFDCQHSKITSLEGAPKEVGGKFDCCFTKITSLEGAPKEVGGDFDCRYTNITSLEGAPTYLGGKFEYDNTPYEKKVPKKALQEDDFEDGEVEFALYDLIDNTEKFYSFDEETDLMKRKTSSIKEYIRSKLFSQVKSIKGLEIFLEDPKFSLQSALDASSSSSGTSMVDDENWTDFLEDIKEAARKRIKKLQG